MTTLTPSRSLSHRLRVSLLMATMATMAVGTLPIAARAQAPDSLRDNGDRRFLRPRELGVLGVGMLAAGALSLADPKIARWTQSSSVQGSDSRKRVVNDITHVNETTLTVAGIAAYGIGRLSHAEALTDIAKHTTEAIVLTSLVSQALRGPLGRTRPLVTHDSDQYDFHAFKGFGNFDNRSWPSLHAATAFAAGSALVSEVKERHPEAMPWAAPLIYAAAFVPGFTRMYLDQHWASDILAGSVIGAVFGNRIVHFAHSAKPGDGPRWLVNATVQPGVDGSMMFGLSVQP